MGNKIHLFTIIILSLQLKLINPSTANSKESAGECHLQNHDKCVDGEAFEELKKYTTDSNTILQNLQKAMQNYEPCSDKGDTACSCHADVITHDLEPFRKDGITKECIAASAKYGTRYKIHRQKLYREERCMFPARCSGIEHFIKLLLPRLKDMDMVINTRDWPQIHTGFVQKMAVFSFSKTKDYSDIMYPAWSFWAGGPAITLHPAGIGRWDLQRLKITQEKNALHWEQKLSKGFFRGSRTSDERDTLVLLSRRQPKLVDAKYTKNQAWKSPNDTLHAEPAQEVSFEAHCQYKYLFNFRGVAASFRLKHLFLCKSLVFHVGTEWQEFYYPAMKPWVHYVPLHSYPTEDELESMLRFFRLHDDLAQQIAERGYQFIWQHLRMEDVECFWERLLTQYQKLIQYNVEAEPDMLLK